jgi:hypothetical protein
MTMKKQFLREHHNRQDKTKKPDYCDRLKEEGDNFDRGGTDEKRLISFRGRSVIFNVGLFLSDDKESLRRTLEHGLKFVIDGETGTVSQLLRKPKVAKRVGERFDMTWRSVSRATEFVGFVQHPKKNSDFRVIEFNCFLQPLEPFPNPIFKRYFAFDANVVKPVR